MDGPLAARAGRQIRFVGGKHLEQRKFPALRRPLFLLAPRAWNFILRRTVARRAQAAGALPAVARAAAGSKLGNSRKLSAYHQSLPRSYHFARLHRIGRAS